MGTEIPETLPNRAFPVISTRARTAVYLGKPTPFSHGMYLTRVGGKRHCQLVGFSSLGWLDGEHFFRRHFWCELGPLWDRACATHDVPEADQAVGRSLVSCASPVMSISGCKVLRL